MRSEEKPQPFMLKVIGFSFALLLGLLALFGSVIFEHSETQSAAVKILTGTDVGAFSKVTPGYTLTFPKDYGAHDDFRQEWWYVTANLTDKRGTEYGVQWTLFRSAVAEHDGDGWNDNHIYMAHAVVTTVNGVYAAERFSRGGTGQAGAAPAPFNVWLDNWQWLAASEAPFPARLEASDADFSFSLQMTQQLGEVLQGEAGYSRKHPQHDVASYYFSVPAIEMSGSITLDGERVEVSGLGWMDREWSSAALAENQQGWNWFSLHLDDKRALMVVQVRSDDGFYRFGSLTSANGDTRILSNEDIKMVPSAFDKMSMGRHIPISWDITVADEGLSLHTEPLHVQNWLDFMFPYWEGPVRVSGSQQGMGFMEATGY